MVEERIQKLMARANIASRRKSEEMITEGRVVINGRLATLGDKADPDKDKIMVDGQRLKITNAEKRYYVVYKPPNVLSTNEKPVGDKRPTVRDLLPAEGHFFSVGRLDVESEGLMVLTNDGDLAHRLTHPRYEHTKTYKVTVYGKPTPEILVKWENGVWLDGERVAPCFIRMIEEGVETCVLRIIMIEGRKRQIRRIASLLGHPVKRLVRTHIGKLGLGTLKRGDCFKLEKEQVDAMLTPADELKFIQRKNRKFHGRVPHADHEE